MASLPTPHRARLHLFLLTAAALFLSGATAEEPVYLASGDVALRPKDVTQKVGACPERPCLSVAFSFPEVEGPKGKDTAELPLARQLRTLLLTALELPEDAASVEAGAQSFSRRLAEEFEELRNQSTAPSPEWFVERHARVSFRSPTMITVEIETKEHTGGAHPISTRRYLNIDSNSGRKLSLGDILVADFEPRLRQLAEDKFRTARRLGPGESLVEAGYQFKDNRFALPENFAFDENGLLLYYNAYEIAPYAAGPTELHLSFSEIEPLTRKDGPLSAALTLHEHFTGGS